MRYLFMLMLGKKLISMGEGMVENSEKINPNGGKNGNQK